ncbi:12996_t:CDS:2, partial [Cetraspora pellucida]
GSKQYEIIWQQHVNFDVVIAMVIEVLGTMIIDAVEVVIDEPCRSRNSSLSSENTRLYNELSSKSTEIGIKSGQLVSVNRELTITKTQLTETKGELTTTKKELKDLGDLFKKLEIESNDKDREIEIKSKDIKNLKGQVEEFQEKDFNRKFKEQEERLDEFVNKLGISRQKYRDLLKFCQQKIRFSENYNQDKIDEAEGGIEEIKDELLSSG